MPAARLFQVEGYVQGVGFRYWTQREATALKLTGYVKNLHDGGVEVYAIGPDSKLDVFRDLLEQGPTGSRVIAVHESPAPVRDYKVFRIEY